MAERRDKWWEISSDEQAIEVGEELARVLQQAALPQFQTVSSNLISPGFRELQSSSG